MPSAYAPWAPQVLIKFIEGTDDPAEKASLIRLATKADMEALWKSLDRHLWRARAIRPDRNHGDYVADFLGICGGARRHFTVPWLTTPESEKRKEMERIETLALQLADLLDQTNSPLNYVKFAYVPQTWSDDMSTQDVMWHGFISGVREDRSTGSLRPSDVLRDLAKTAHCATHFRALVPKPNSKTAARTYFIQEVTKYLKDQYRQPLHNVVALAAQAYFDDEQISVETVKDALRHV